MLLHGGNEFHKDQAGFQSTQITPALQGEKAGYAGSALLSQAMDRLAASDTGAGEPIYPYAKITNAANYNPGVSADVQIWGDDGVNGQPSQTFGALVNPVKLSGSGVVPVANLLAGTLLPMAPLTPGIRKRFLYAYIVIAGANPTTGAIVAGLVDKSAREQVFVQPSGTPTGLSL